MFQKCFIHEIVIVHLKFSRHVNTDCYGKKAEKTQSPPKLDWICWANGLVLSSNEYQIQKPDFDLKRQLERAMNNVLNFKYNY